MCVWWNTHCSQFHATPHTPRQWKRHSSRETQTHGLFLCSMRGRERLKLIQFFVCCYSGSRWCFFSFPSHHIKYIANAHRRRRRHRRSCFRIYRKVLGRLDSLSRLCMCVCDLCVPACAHWLNSTLSNDIYLFVKLKPGIRALFLLIKYISRRSGWFGSVYATRAATEVLLFST